MEAAQFLVIHGIERTKEICADAGVSFSSYLALAKGLYGIRPERAKKLEIASNHQLTCHELIFPKFRVVAKKNGRPSRNAPGCQLFELVAKEDKEEGRIK